MSFLYHILLLNVVCISATAALRCPYNITACKCRYAYGDVTCSDLREMPPLQTGSDIMPLNLAKFINGGIAKIPADALPSGLVRLLFTNHPLTDISGDAFLASADTLNDITVLNSTLKKLPDALGKLTNLTTLTIADTPIEDWNNATLQHIAPKLNLLKLINVGITTWPTWLSVLHSLTSVDLSHNSIQFIPPEANVPSINFLVLSYNAFTEIDLDKIPPDVSSLILNFNNISKLTDSHSAIASNLTLLDLGSNPISSISPSAFKNLKSLTDLILSGTNLTDLPVALASLTKLEVLLMSSSSSLTCLCPLPTELIEWYKTVQENLLIEGYCFPLQHLDIYLRNACHTPTTTPRDDSSTLACDVCCRYGCLLLLLISYFFVLNK